MTRALAIGAAAACVVAIAGCPSPPEGIKQPVPSWVSGGVRRGGAGALLVRSEIDVRNPNSFAVELLVVDWEVSVGGGSPVRGRAEFGVPIAPGKAEPITLRMRLPPIVAAPAVGRLSGGTAQIRVAGVMHFSSDRGPVALTFDVAGGVE